MTNHQDKLFLPQINGLIARYDDLRHRSKYEDLSDLRPEVYEFVVASSAAIRRAVGGDSEYARQLDRIFEQSLPFHPSSAVLGVLGMLRAVSHDIECGYLAVLC